MREKKKNQSDKWKELRRKSIKNPEGIKNMKKREKFRRGNQSRISKGKEIAQR